jgi:hypothetical protein
VEELRTFITCLLEGTPTHLHGDQFLIFLSHGQPLIGASKRKETGVLVCVDSNYHSHLVSSPLEQIESGRPAERNEDEEPWTATHAREHPLGCAQQIANCKETPFLIEIIFLGHLTENFIGAKRSNI